MKKSIIHEAIPAALFGIALPLFVLDGPDRIMSGDILGGVIVIAMAALLTVVSFHLCKED